MFMLGTDSGTPLPTVVRTLNIREGCAECTGAPQTQVAEYA